MLKNIIDDFAESARKRISEEYPCVNTEDRQFRRFLEKIFAGDYVLLQFKIHPIYPNPSNYFIGLSNNYLRIEDNNVEIGIDFPDKLEILLKDEHHLILPDTLKLADL